MAIFLVKRLEHELGIDVILLQEAGVWDRDYFETETGWTMISYGEGQRDVVILLKGMQASWMAWSGTCTPSHCAFFRFAVLHLAYLLSLSIYIHIYIYI